MMHQALLPDAVDLSNLAAPIIGLLMRLASQLGCPWHCQSCAVTGEGVGSRTPDDITSRFWRPMHQPLCATLITAKLATPDGFEPPNVRIKT